MSLKLIVSCMFAGKTTELLSNVNRYHIAQKSCLIIKHPIDTRYDHIAQRGGIITHSGFEYHSIGDVLTTADLTAIDITNYDVIAVDELQFFSRESVMMLTSWASRGKIVIGAGLNGDFRQHNFGHLHELFPHAEKICKLHAICKLCNNSADFTKRIITPADNTTSNVDVGGADKYIPVCRKCL